MSRAVVRIATLACLACGSPPPSPSFDAPAQEESVRIWATTFAVALNKLGGCGTGTDARALLAPEGYLFTSDSATLSLSGEAATGMFEAAACSRRATAFAFDSIIVRSLAPGVGAVIGTYTETVTHTANARQRTRGTAQWIVQRGTS